MTQLKMNRYTEMAYLMGDIARKRAIYNTARKAGYYALADDALRILRKAIMAYNVWANEVNNA